MEKMYINEYKPPQDYYNQFKNEDFFNDQYMKYIQQLQKDINSADAQEENKSDAPVIPAAKSLSSTEYQDRDDSLSS